MAVSAYIERLGVSVRFSLIGLGVFTNYLTRVFYWMFRRPFRLRLLMEQLYFIGNKSLFIVCLTGSFAGAVMAYQIYFGFRLISADSFVGPIVAISLSRELAPVLTGLIVAGRAGAAMAAQIGTMKVTEQIDALEVMGVSSYQYLALPRIIGTTLSLPILTSIFLLVGNIGAFLIGVKVLNIDEIIFYSKLGQTMYVQDVYQGLIKALFFGFIVSSIGTYCGFQVKGGAEGVGRGTNQAVVWGMVIVLIMDFFLTSFLVKIM